MEIIQQGTVKGSGVKWGITEESVWMEAGMQGKEVGKDRKERKVVDVLTEKQRHKAMSNIRSKDTSIEVKLRKALWHKGYHYRKNYPKLPGRPDIVLTKYKIAIFCDSEFFHGKDWYTILRPRLQRGKNAEFWESKIWRNMKRDEENNKELLFMGWTVIRFWGDEIVRNTESCVAVVEECIFDQQVKDIRFNIDDDE